MTGDDRALALSCVSAVARRRGRRRGSRRPGRFGRGPAEGREPEFPPPTHPRVQAEVDAGRRRSIRCRARSSRSSTSTATSRRRSRRPSSTASSTGDGREQPPGAGQPSGALGRPAAGRRSTRIRSEPVQGPDGAVRRTSTSATSVPASARGRPRSSKPTSRPARSALARSSRTSACASEGRRHRLKLDDPELDPIWETCARLEHPGAHPHRRAAGVLRAASTTTTSAGSSSRSIRIAAIQPASSRASRS